MKTRWKFLNYKQINGLQFPQLIENYEGDDVGWRLECDDVQIGSDGNLSQKMHVIHKTKEDHSNVIFDLKKTSLVQGKLSSDGRIFLPVKINGEQAEQSDLNFQT
eukprot:TRINITY_DN7966_c3_g1_i1.p1 TRINITY_DN7966_c3_g1~~TRINITY_DN7966_c3_g1_i1.p1  ORF type:complete len:117 (-),score=17.69 TRINITY_DN7966_c3_g1_i1:19-333(-)